MTPSPAPTRPNFFLLLDLNPDAAWSQTLFEETLRKKRNEWSRQGAGVAKKALVAKQNLALIPKIIEVMTNAEMRAQEAIAARKERAADQQKEQEQFEKQLAFINAQDTLDQEEIEKFVAAFQHLLPADEIRKRINVPASTPQGEATSTQASTTLEESIAKNITDRLQIIHMSTLYELLTHDLGAKSASQSMKTDAGGTGSAQGAIPAYPERHSTEEWLQAAEVLYARLVRQQPTAETTAKMELAGLARYVFKNDQTRASYDETLRQASWQRLFHELAESMGRAKKKEVNAKQVALFLNDAQKDGWSEQEALKHLKEYAQQQQWSIIPPTRESERTVSPAPPVPLERKRSGNRMAQTEATRLHTAHQQVGKALHDGQLTLTFTEIQIPTSGTPSTAVTPDTNTPRGVRISWSPLQEPALDLAPSQYVIVQSSKPLNMAGKAVTTEEIEGLGRVLPVRAQDAPNSRSDACKPFVMAYYTPLVVIQQQAYIGHSQPYLYVENISGLTAQYLGSTIRLRWHWPQSCQEVLLSYRRHTWPHHNEADATTCVVTQDAYKQAGYYDLSGPIDYDCYMLISAITTREQQQFTASGIYLVMRMGTRTTLTYEIIQPAFLRKQRLLRIIIDAPGVIPALQLVSKRGQIPLRRTDGELFYRIAGIGDATTQTRQNQQRRELTIPLPEQVVPSKTYGKLFLEDDTHYRNFLIHHPSATQMRLS